VKTRLKLLITATCSYGKGRCHQVKNQVEKGRTLKGKKNSKQNEMGQNKKWEATKDKRPYPGGPQEKRQPERPGKGAKEKEKLPLAP